MVTMFKIKQLNLNYVSCICLTNVNETAPLKEYSSFTKHVILLKTEGKENVVIEFDFRYYVWHFTGYMKNVPPVSHAIVTNTNENETSNDKEQKQQHSSISNDIDKPGMY